MHLDILQLTALNHENTCSTIENWHSKGGSKNISGSKYFVGLAKIILGSCLFSSFVQFCWAVGKTHLATELA